MRVCGVICEYDPFHNGHAHLLRTLREKIGCDYVVCAMSGSFTQRGEAALMSKWARAEMALQNGADAVFELPAIFALRDAQRFARGGVELLCALGVVTHLGFGSECGDLPRLETLAGNREDPEAFQKALAEGKPVGQARSEAAGLTLGAPNDVLAVEYLRAAQGRLEAYAVRREGGGHAETQMSEYTSASAIRAALRRGEDVSRASPAHAIMQREIQAGRWTDQERFDLSLLAFLRNRPALSEAADAGEGLENRILRSAEEASSREEVLEGAKCKRYTRARLSRVMTQGWLGITKEMAENHPVPEYARLLGFREEARPLLAQIQKKASLPIVQRTAQFRRQGGDMLALDVRAGDLWALLCRGKQARSGGQDWNTPVLRIK